MPSAPATSGSSSLKTKLKTWEHQFKASEGRLPTKADIKANPEIAQMYNTYNASRKGPRISDDALHPSSINKVESQALRTPSRTNRTGNSTRIPQSPPQGIFTPSKIQTGKNSPSKLRKIVQDHTSPRKVLNNNFNVKSKRSSSQIKQTPNRIISQSPFDVDSGGGKGSPNLFADLLLESAKETPRTKARKFLSGMGSPLKPSRLSNSENVSNLDDQNGVGGLSSFLRETAKTPEKTLAEKKVFEDHNGDDADDEVLGPSPFKPIPNAIFQPLFDNPVEENSDHLMSINSPTKRTNPKWKKSSSIPFIPQSQNKSSNPDQALESAQRGSGHAEKRKDIGLGVKRKRVLGSGAEEQSRFYNNQADPDKPQTSSMSLNKKTKVSKKIRNQTNQSNLSLNKKVKSIQLKSNLLNEEESKNPEEAEELISKTLDLPYGNPDESAVYTELENFKFTRPTGKNDQENEDDDSNITITRSSEKGKGKMKSKVSDTTTTPVRLGTQKVLVRAYRPIEVNQFKFIGPSSTHMALEDFDQPYEGNFIDDHKHPEEEEELGEEDDYEKSEFNQQPNQEEDAEAEADLQISEELMNVLNIDNDLTIEGTDRSHLLRELKREQKVREILEGKRVTVFERTFTRPSSNNLNDLTLNKFNKKLSRSKNPINKKFIDQIKSTPNQKPLYNANKNLQGQSDHEDDSLQFELGLDELQNEEKIESHLLDDDDDWEDEPSGWKTSDRLVDFGDDVDD